VLPKKLSDGVSPLVASMAALDTPLSLLDRLLTHEDNEAWEHFSSLDEPLIRRWVGRLRSRADYVDDVTQEVLKALVEGLPGFRHNLRKGAFRAWLRSITLHRIRRHWRGQHPTAVQLSEARDLEDARSAQSRLWDDEHNRHVVRSLLEKVLPEFDDKVQQIFRRVVLGGSSPQEVAADLGCSLNVVYIGKSHVLKRLRLEAEGLVE
jgi:RNA polymerase sigma-70 factor, ECF subfamily